MPLTTGSIERTFIIRSIAVRGLNRDLTTEETPELIDCLNAEVSTSDFPNQDAAHRALASFTRFSALAAASLVFGILRLRIFQLLLSGLHLG